LNAKKSSKPITLAIQRFDRTAPLQGAILAPENVTVLFVPPRVSVEGITSGVFDAAEMPLAHYAFLKDVGDPYTAIPVFTDRLFIQQYVYTRPDTGITSPGQLRGRRVLVPMYYMTASLWHRTMLEDDYGIQPKEITWHTTGPERDPRMRLPKGVTVVHTPGPHLGVEKLLDGTVDCLMTEGTPSLVEGDRDKVIRLNSDVHGLQKEYYRKTGFHIIVHLIVIRKEVISERPELPEELCTAFDRAKELAYRTLQNERMTSLPLMRSYLDETVSLFGPDPWSYGLERNWKELDQFLTHAHHQGLTNKKMDPDELFDNSARAYQFQAKMI
jgi:4,5-dihydroxyphthalate decarboxylase